MQHKGSILRLIQLAGAVLVHKYSQLVPTVQAANCYLKVFWLSSLEWAVRMKNEDCTVANWGESPGHYKLSASPLTSNKVVAWTPHTRVKSRSCLQFAVPVLFLRVSLSWLRSQVPPSIVPLHWLYRSNRPNEEKTFHIFMTYQNGQSIFIHLYPQIEF